MGGTTCLPAQTESKTEPATLRQLTDQALLERYAARCDQEAFALLVQRHGKVVWSVCRRLLRQEDAEDAFQAVFVVLARKAASIRDGEAVGSWLHGVAYRTAMCARRCADRRQKHERQASAEAQRAGRTSQVEPWGEAACREVQRLLDDEVQRLTPNYRAPFVLCCLRGMGKSEAARELGWKEGTVSGRLARARKLLLERLARRGVVLSAALTGLALAESAAATPPEAVRIAAEGAPLAGKSAACTVSPTAIHLAETVLRTLKVRGLLPGLAVLLALLLLVGGATLAGLELTSGAPDPDLFVGPPVALGTPIDEQVLSVAFAPNGKRLLTAGGSTGRPGQIQIWDVAGRTAVATLRPLPGVRSLAFAPDGQNFASADFKGDIQIRDATTGEERVVVHAHDGGTTSVVFAPDGASLLSTGKDRTVKVWQASGLVEQRTFRGHGAPVLAADFFHDTPALATGGEDNTVIVWDRNTGKAKWTLRGHQMAIESVAVSPNDKLVASASCDGTVRLWNADSGAARAILDHDGVAVHAVAFSRDGKMVGTATADGKVRVWDARTWKLIGVVGHHTAAARAVAFSPDGSWLASGGSDQTAKLWPLQAGKQPMSLLSRSEYVQPIRALAYAPDGSEIAMATTRPEIQIRDASSGDVLRVLRGHAAAVNCLTFSKGGQLLASGSADRTVRLWDTTTAQEVLKLQQDGEVHALTFTPDDTRLACAGSDGVVRLWDIASAKESKRFADEAAVLAVAAAPDGKALVTCTAAGTIRIWDLSGARDPVSLKAHTGPVRALAFSAAGILASAGDDHRIKLWDPALGRERALLTGHEDAVTALAFTPGGRRLVSGSRDQTLRIWDSDRGEFLKTLHGHQQAVTALAVHPRGKNLVSGSLDTMALRWRGTSVAGSDSTARPKVFKTAMRLEQQQLHDKMQQDLDAMVARLQAAEIDADAGDEVVAPRSMLWLLSCLALGLVMAYFVFWFYVRRRRRSPRVNQNAAAPPPSTPHGPQAPAVFIGNMRQKLSRPYVWLAAVGSLLILGATVVVLNLPQGGGDEMESEFYQDFRGRPLSADFAPLHIRDEKMLHGEAQGIHIKIPRDWIHPWGGVGLVAPISIKGDFEITTTVQIVHTDQPPSGSGCGAGVCLHLRKVGGGGASVHRVLLPNGRQVVLCDHTDAAGKGPQYPSPCTDTVGRLRLKRKGGMLSCQWAPGTEGDNFEERQTLDFGTDDIDQIRLAAVNGRTNAEVNARFLDFRLRSELSREDLPSTHGWKTIAVLPFGLLLVAGLFFVVRAWLGRVVDFSEAVPKPETPPGGGLSCSGPLSEQG